MYQREKITKTPPIFGLFPRTRVFVLQKHAKQCGVKKPLKKAWEILRLLKNLHEQKADFEFDEHTGNLNLGQYGTINLYHSLSADSSELFKLK